MCAILSFIKGVNKCAYLFLLEEVNLSQLFDTIGCRISSELTNILFLKLKN